MKKRIVSIVVLLLAVFSAHGQNFTHSLALPAVDSTGYYDVYLPASVYSVCKSRFEDIRVFETGKKQQLPYLLKLSNENPVPKKAVGQNIAYKVTAQTAEYIELLLPAFAKPYNSNLTFYMGPDNSAIATMNVWVKNTHEGSNYINSTFSVLDKDTGIYINCRLLDDEGEIKVKINHSGGKNFKLKKIINYTYEEDLSAYHLIEGIDTKTTNETDKKITSVSGKLPFQVPVALVRVDFDSTGFFKRYGGLTLTTDGKRSFLSSNPVQNFGVTFDNGPTEIETENFRANSYTLQISNNDNPLLPVKSIRFFAPKLYLRVRLEAGKAYVVKMGDPDLKNPNYDLEYDNTSNVVNTLTISTPPIAIEDDPATKSRKTLLLWGSMGLCILVLGGMAYSMVRKA